MKLVKIEEGLFSEESLPGGRADSYSIEFTADAVIDVGILDDENYQRFVGADSDRGIKKLKWFAEVKNKKFIFEPPSPYVYYWLILWNCYSNKIVTVGYSVTELLP
jgi:hypothetical protein